MVINKDDSLGKPLPYDAPHTFPFTMNLNPCKMPSFWKVKELQIQGYCKYNIPLDHGHSLFKLRLMLIFSNRLDYFYNC